MTRAAALLAAALAALLAPAAEADTAARIAAAAAGVAEAGQVLAAAKAAPQQVAAFGRAIGAYEAAVARLGEGVAAAAAEEAALSQDLAAREVEIARLLATLELMSLAPVPPRPLHPDGPLGAARATAMTERLTPALRAEADRLSRQLGELRPARTLRERSGAELEAALGVLNEAQAAMAATLAESAPDASGPANPTVTMMARDSETLTALAAALAGQAGAPAPPEDARAGFGWPVEGTVLHRFGEADAAGVRRSGIVVGAAPFALVSAPADGIVRYAGPFLEYGYVVVLEPDSATMLVLAGLSRLQVANGDAVRRGDLLGLLGGREAGVEEYVMPPESDGAGNSETLYIEVRQGRGPVDPEPLFVGEDG